MGSRRNPPPRRVFGGGEMGELVRTFAWGAHPLGPIEQWPQVLVTTVNTLLNSRFPKVVYWSRELYAIYNNGYRAILGARHSPELGRYAADIWPEIKEYIVSMVDAVHSTGEPTFLSDHALMITRSGYVEEGYFTFSCSPVYLENGTCGGVLTTITETTERIVGERRLRALRDLGSMTSGKRTVDEAADAISEVLRMHNADTIFSLLYLPGDNVQRLHLKARSCIAAEHPAAAREINLAAGAACSPLPLYDVVQHRRMQVVGDLDRLYSAPLPGGRWADAAQTAALCPIACTWDERALGVLVIGLNPRRPFDESYRAHIELLAGQVANAISTAKSSSDDRKRVQMLAELDRAKTAFFSNVSHELRTPLTLVLGSLEQIASDREHAIPIEQRGRLNLAQRNSSRLLKLVNALLDYSRIEAGRLSACFVPTELGTLTADLASMFRSLMETGGLRYDVVIEPIGEAVYVDVDLWEKIVLNLLSNAFKFTLRGTVLVQLRRGTLERHVESTQSSLLAGAPQVDSVPAAVLSVTDTGCGVPADKLARLFERFYRVEASQGRSYEGSGIGLALTHELVKLHGGRIDVRSEHGAGSTFTVTIPLGSRHLPPEQVHDSAPRLLGDKSNTGRGRLSTPFVEEASRWLPDTEARMRHDPVNLGTVAPSLAGRHEMDVESASSLSNSASGPAQSGSSMSLLAAEDDMEVNESLSTLTRLALSGAPTGGSEASTLPMSTASGQALVPLASTSTVAPLEAKPARSRRANKTDPTRSLEWSPSGGASLEDDETMSPQTIYRHVLRGRHPDGKKPTVLLVDDNADMRMFMQSLLSTDFSVFTAVDGQEALERVLASMNTFSDVPDVVVADVMMPRLDGLGLVRQLRAQEGTRHIPVILLSALAGEDARVEGLQSGADDYLCKPFSAKELLARVQAHLSMSLLRAHLEEMVQQRTRQLLDTQEQFRNLAHLSPVGILRSTMEGHIVYANDRCLAMLGVERWEADAKPTLAQWVYADDRHLFASPVYEAHLREQCEFRLVRPGDGRVVWVCGQSAPEMDPQTGVLRGYISALTDITEQKRLVAEHFAAVARAEQEAQQRATDADEHRRQQETFVDMVCHEIRNPLNGIVNNMDLLQTNTMRRRELLLSLPESAERAQLLEQVTDDLSIFTSVDICMKHQRKVTDDVLNLSRLSSGNVALSLEPMRPVPIVRSIADMFAAQARAHAIDLVCDLPSPPQDDIVFQCDPYRLSQVLINLVSNAIKFTARAAERRVTIKLAIAPHVDASSSSSSSSDVSSRRSSESSSRATASSSSSSAAVSTSTSGALVPQPGNVVTLRATVSDTGIGIAPDELTTLFQRFRQANSKTYNRYGGSGLGLHITKLVLGLMGGSVDVTSVPLQGSTFVVTVPCRVCHKSELQPTAASEHMVAIAAAATAPAQETLKRHAEEEYDGPSSESLARPSVSLPGKVGAEGENSASPLPRRRRLSQDGQRRVLNILVVEDNDINQRVLRRQLELASEFKCQTQVASNGQEAVDRYVHEGPFDVILMDVEMPVMDGLAATRRIREHEAAAGLRAVPIVGVSGNARDVHIAAGFAAGMTEYLIKPYKKEQLVQLVIQATAWPAPQ